MSVLTAPTLHQCRDIGRSENSGACSNVIGIICPPILVIELTNMPKNFANPLPQMFRTSYGLVHIVMNEF